MRADIPIRAFAAFTLWLVATMPAHAAATVTIVNANEPGIGFNDTTPAVAVGGNTGATLGEQRLALFRHAASLWGAALDSPVEIRVLARFAPLQCTATSGVLGSAGPTTIFRDFPNAPKAGTWYPGALASKLANQDLNEGAPAISTQFNLGLGGEGCLTGQSFYLGLDNRPGDKQVDLLPVLLHELGHGLGFLTFTDGSTGQQESEAADDGYPSIWDWYLLDTSSGLHWAEMDNSQRRASALRPRSLVWDGPAVRRAAYGQVPAGPAGRPASDGFLSRLRADGVLDRGSPQLSASGPGLSRDMLIGVAGFGPAVGTVSVAGTLLPAAEDAPALACDPVARDFAGAVVLVDRGTCTFVTKVKNLQAAKASAVLVVDNVAGSPPPDLGGADASITIPAVRISKDDGAALRKALAQGPVRVKLATNPLRLSGADPRGRPLLYTVSPYAPGSSVSHFDTSASPNLLMEPNITSTLKQALQAPDDLTVELLRDIGW